MYVKHLTEHAVEGKRLGRHVKHDPRSLWYLYPADLVADLVSVRHQRGIPVLDQGNVGSCTGNAAEGACGTGAIYTAIPTDLPTRPKGSRETATALSTDEAQAVALYSSATAMDSYQGTYPPEDTGSDGLSVAKAAQKAGLISGYTHCTSLNSALAALSQQPVIAGINWYDSFDNPDQNGLIKIDSGAQVRGGHEICLDELNVEKKLIGFTNSWGTGWGAEGRAFLPWADFKRLLSEDGDVTVFTPLSQPAPTPTPPPGPSDNPLNDLVKQIETFITNVNTWLKDNHLI